MEADKQKTVPTTFGGLKSEEDLQKFIQLRQATAEVINAHLERQKKIGTEVSLSPRHIHMAAKAKLPIARTQKPMFVAGERLDVTGNAYEVVGLGKDLLLKGAGLSKGEVVSVKDREMRVRKVVGDVSYLRPLQGRLVHQ